MYTVIYVVSKSNLKIYLPCSYSMSPISERTARIKRTSGEVY